MEKVVQIVDSRSKHSDKEFWMSKTPSERIAAVETLRLQYIKLHGIQQGLQRICRITSLK